MEIIDTVKKSQTNLKTNTKQKQKSVVERDILIKYKTCDLENVVTYEITAQQKLQNELLFNNQKLQNELKEVQRELNDYKTRMCSREKTLNELSIENQQLKGQLTNANSKNDEFRKEIDQMHEQLYDLENTKKYAEMNKLAARKLTGMENEYYILKEKNADLIHRNFCLTFEKNELYNLIKILERKIYKSDKEHSSASQQTESMTNNNAKMKTNDGATLLHGNQLYSSSDVLDLKRTTFETDKANLIRQVEFYKNKLYVNESTLQKRDKEIQELKQKLISLTNKVEVEQLDFQKRYDEITEYHKNKVSELYELWKKDYTNLEYSNKVKDNELLTLQEKYSKVENDLLQCQKVKREMEEFKEQLQTLEIKYNTEVLKNSKQQTQLANIHEKEIIKLKNEVKQLAEIKTLQDEKLNKIQSLLTLEISKNDHLREKCRDYWTLLTAKDDQLKIAQKTVEHQIIERQRLQKQIDFYKGSTEQPSHEFSTVPTKQIIGDLTPEDAVQQLYRNTTFQSKSSELADIKKSRVCVLEKYNKSSTAIEKHSPSTQSNSGGSVKLIFNGNALSSSHSQTLMNSPIDNIVSENLRDFTIAKNSVSEKRRSKKL